MDSKPLISVVMPVYNESISDLKESIDSVISQTYRHFEFIIIDDNPSNVNIKNYISKRASQDNRIQLIFNTNNLKLTKSENKGIKLSRGKYIARIDADDIAYKNRLSSQLSFMLCNHLDIASSNFSLINENSQLTRTYTFKGYNIINQNSIKSIMKYGNIAVGPTFMFRKKAFNETGKYRDFNGEDYDLVSRFLINGYRYGFEINPLIYKRLRKNSITYHGTLDQYMAERSISYYLRKYKYNKVMPIKYLKLVINNLSLTERRDFKRYSIARYRYNDEKSILNFLKIIFVIISSKIVFERCLWSLFNKYKVNR